MTTTARARMASAVLPVTLGPVLNGRAHGAIPSGSSGGRSRERSGADVRFIWRFMDVAIWCMVGQGHGGCGSDHKAHHGQPVAFVLEEVEGLSFAGVDDHIPRQAAKHQPDADEDHAHRPTAPGHGDAPRPGPGHQRRRHLRRGGVRARDPAAIADGCGAGAGCGGCRPALEALLAACAWPAQWFQRRLGALVSFPSGIADVIPADRRTADGLLALTTPAGSRTPGSFASPGGKDASRPTGSPRRAALKPSVSHSVGRIGGFRLSTAAPGPRHAGVKRHMGEDDRAGR